MLPSPQLPDPLALTGDQFVRAASGRVRVAGRGGDAGALDAYRLIFREGPASVPALSVRTPRVVRTLVEDSPEGEVVKFVQRLDDSRGVRNELREAPLDIESVLIPMVGSRGRRNYTLCVSSQVGCAMGCGFCETAQMGLVRSLTPAEIVAQWYAATHELKRGVSNIVFMGMGEPMDNLDSVIQAIAILKDHNAAHVPVSKITVSTVGRVDGIRRLAEQVRQPGWHRLGLAFSLNAPNDADRSAIMPINRRWNLAEAQQALLDWPRYAGNKLCIEYVLIPGVNDTRDHARQAADFIRPFGLLRDGRIGGQPLRAVLNLIPYNPRRDSPWPAPDEARVDEFLSWLIDLGVFAKRRRTKGRDMMGACGQLGSPNIRQRRLVEPTISA